MLFSSKLYYLQSSIFLPYPNQIVKICHFYEQKAKNDYNLGS